MTSISCDITEHFNKLRTLNSADFDAIAVSCLRIIILLIEEKDLGQAIAKELSLVIDFSHASMTEEELFLNIQNIEQELEENLRGFSGLMELILEDTRIRRDPEVLLEKIKEIEPRLYHPFARLCHALYALLELEEAFILEFSKAATTIFLLALTDIRSCIFQEVRMKSEQNIFDWLENRIKNANLSALYEQVLSKTNFKVSSSISIDLVVIRLSLWSSDQHVLKQEEALILDEVLGSLGMMGIKPLIEAGFLQVEECGKENRFMASLK